MNLKPLQAMFKNNFNEFMRVLNNPNETPANLSFALEILCEQSSDKELILSTSKKLLTHRNAIVRESALIAISSFSEELPADILTIVKNIAANDPSPAVKSEAIGIVEKIK